MSNTALTQLVGDIGGTNARFALVDQHMRPQSARTYAAAKFSSLTEALRQFLSDTNIGAVDAASIAVATPVTAEDSVAFTNNLNWSFSKVALAKELNIANLHVVNDFTALAMSVPHITPDNLRKIGGGNAMPMQPVGVVGPGTGLGVSGMVPLGSNGDWRALNSEGGHAAASATSKRELDVLALFIEEFGHVSFERFLSGPGLVNIYSALCKLDGVNAKDLEPAEVTELGLAEKDQQCAETLHLFCGLLGSFAGDLALTLGASGGIYIGGGVVPRLGDFFVQSAFRKRFESKGRVSDEMYPIPTYVIHDPYPGLLGAATLLPSAL